MTHRFRMVTVGKYFCISFKEGFELCESVIECTFNHVSSCLIELRVMSLLL